MIRIKREGPKNPPPDFQRKLRDYNRTHGSPEAAIRWNPISVDLGLGYWDPRWEIWIEVTDNTKQKKVVKSEGDVEEDGRTWRFLNTWQYADNSFAPLDDRVFQALRDADTWTHPETYHEMIEEPERYRKEQEFKVLQDTAYGMRTNWR
jgi:hypothetical protein